MRITQKHIQAIKTYFRGRSRLHYVIVFGSAIKNLRFDSDIDLLVGERLNFVQRTEVALCLEQEVGRKVDVICIDDAPCGLALEAFAHGSPVMVRDAGRLKRDYFMKYHEYENNAPLRRIRAEKIKRDLVYG
jgi:predicted nucleotidyltransferase